MGVAIFANSGVVAVTHLLTALVLLLVVWGSTTFVQVPLHGRLARGLDATALRRLVLTNWIRTAAWTLRAGLLVLLAIQLPAS